MKTLQTSKHSSKIASTAQGASSFFLHRNCFSLVRFFCSAQRQMSCDRGVFTDFIFKTKSPVTMKTYWNVGFFRGLCLSVLNLDFITSIGKSNTCRNRFQIPSADRRSLSIDSNWFFSDWGSDDSLENSPFLSRTETDYMNVILVYYFL